MNSQQCVVLQNVYACMQINQDAELGYTYCRHFHMKCLHPRCVSYSWDAIDTLAVFTLHNVGSYLGSNVVSIHIDFVFTLPRKSTSKVGYDVSGTSPLIRMLERPGSKAPLRQRQISRRPAQAFEGQQFVCRRLILAHRI